MAIKLWPHVLKTATPLGEPPVATEVIGWHAGDWMLQRRDRSEWNPPAPPAIGASASDADMQRGEPHWADTQPWWHD